MIDRGKHDLLGIGIDAVDYEGAVERVVTAARERRGMAVSALAVHGVMTGVLDRGHRYRLNTFELLVPDGQPVRWGLNWLHRTCLRDRVYGPNLMLHVCERAAKEGLPIYLYGATEEMLAKLRTNLLQQFPDLKIAGTQASRFRRLSAEEQAEVCANIRASGAMITFVGLGCPRQEVWAFENREALSMPLLAVGAAFAFHAGLLPQAPPALQKRGLEWAYRLVQEPVRLWKRYLLLNPLYLTLLMFQWARVWSIDGRREGRATTAPAEAIRYG
jgi:exopolysaccharide biosynthesis WecB/TagA/CpsF family protein